MEVWALDGFDQIGRITNATRVEVVERDLGEGGWVVEMPVGDAGDVGAGLITATWPGIEVYDPDTGWRFGGYLTDWTIIQDEDGAESLRFVGKDFQSDLAAVLESPDPNGIDAWWSITIGGSIPITSDAHNTVSFNLTGPAARYTPAGLTFGTDPAAGPSKTRRLKGEPLLTVLRALFWGEEYTASLRMKRKPNGDGYVLFDTPARPVAPTVLDVKRGTVGRLEVTTSAGRANWILSMGAEIEPVVTPGERHVAILSTVEFDWRFRHRELFLNRPATDNINALGDENAAAAFDPANQWGRSVKIDSARVYGYGRGLDIGWFVTVHLGRAGQLDSLDGSRDRAGGHPRGAARRHPLHRRKRLAVPASGAVSQPAGNRQHHRPRR